MKPSSPNVSDRDLHDSLVQGIDALVAGSSEDALDEPSGDGAQRSSALQALVELASTIDEARWKRLADRDPELAVGPKALRTIYARYIREREIEETDRLLARGSDAFELADAGDFARNSYARVSDLFERVDFGAFRRIVMIGCGPLPVTLLHMMDETTVPELVGVDVDATAIDRLERLAERFGWDRIRTTRFDGRHFDCSGADLVYVANLVAPKHEVLARVAQGVSPGRTVVLRDPYAAGALFAESGLDRLGREFSVLGVGPGNHQFLSRHVYLRRNEVASS